MARELGSRSIFWFWLGEEKLCIHRIEMKGWSKQIRGGGIFMTFLGKGMVVLPRTGFHLVSVFLYGPFWLSSW